MSLVKEGVGAKGVKIGVSEVDVEGSRSGVGGGGGQTKRRPSPHKIKVPQRYKLPATMAAPVALKPTTTEDVFDDGSRKGSIIGRMLLCCGRGKNS